LAGVVQIGYSKNYWSTQMQLTVPEAAKLLHVSEDVVYQWIRYEGLPASRLSDRYRINRVRLLEWAHKQNLAIRLEGRLNEPILERAIAAGAIFRDLPCHNLGEFARTISTKIPLPTGLSADYFHDQLMIRQQKGWHTTGSGMLVPTARAPIILPSPEASVFITYLEDDFSGHAVDKNKSQIKAIFLIVVPASRLHINLLLRINFVLRDSGFDALIRRKAGKDELINRLRAIGDQA
jgi:excisionase family DNA binding protein